jgi:hypothetical protein
MAPKPDKTQNEIRKVSFINPPSPLCPLSHPERRARNGKEAMNGIISKSGFSVPQRRRVHISSAMFKACRLGRQTLFHASWGKAKLRFQEAPPIHDGMRRRKQHQNIG